ncbi:MAG TPA: hypothetical protein VHU22_22805 [Xanthobacteraceae bacterium]|nr:hypothetical protein [Xanthobacteraceae bacterium]
MTQLYLNFPRSPDAVLNDDTAGMWVWKLYDFYRGRDYIENALAIANLICNGVPNEDTAERLIMAMGYALGAVLNFPKVSPETLAKAKQIRQIALPGIDDAEQCGRHA